MKTNQKENQKTEILSYEQTRINHRIHAENIARKILNAESERIQAILKPFLNSKILDKNGQFIKKVATLINFDNVKNAKIEPFHAGDNAVIHWCFIKTSIYSGYIDLSLCFSGGYYRHENPEQYKTNPYYCEYYDAQRYIFKIENQTLKAFEELEQKPQLNAQTEYNQFLKAQKLYEEYKSERDKLFYPIAKELLKN